MSGFVPNPSQQQSAVQTGQNIFMHSSANPSHQQVSSYETVAKSPVSSPYSRSASQSPLPNYVNSWAAHGQAFYNAAECCNGPPVTHSPANNSSSLGPAASSVSADYRAQDLYGTKQSFAGHQVTNSHAPVENGPSANPFYPQPETNLYGGGMNGIPGNIDTHGTTSASHWTSNQMQQPLIQPPPALKQFTPAQPSITPKGNAIPRDQHRYSDGRTSDANLVPSAGLPLPYNSQTVSTPSPQVTPGPSQPPSARSSRNPSPISAHRYDYMEGQFSNKPSPSNSASNLQSTCLSPPSSMAVQCSTGYLSSPGGVTGTSNSNNTGSSNQMSGIPALGQPYVNAPFSSSMSSMPPPSSQPLQNSPLPAASGPPVVSSPRARHPQQMYPQANQFPSPVLTSQPSSLQSPVPMNSTSQHQVSPYPQQSGVPEGPVGGVAGYDPQLHAKMAGLSVHSSFSRLWGNECVNLLQDKNILPALPLEPPKPALPVDRPNCSPEIFRCTLTKIPDNSSLLQKSRLPFGILIHPFRDVMHLPVIQCNTIVRCRNCRTYINPFVTFVDQRRWKCNLCFRVNDLPEEFLYDPVTRSYGDPARRPEIKNSTIEFIAPSDYMLRPPQPAVYLFVLDVSHGACEIGYLEMFCKTLLETLDELPGDSRTRIGFITFDGSIHFYSFAEGLNQPHMLIVSDVEDIFLPAPDNLLVNAHECRALIRDLLEDLPKRFATNWDSSNCLGAALQAAYKLMAPIGGRVTVIQTCLANRGPGALKNREDPNQRAAKDVANVGPANDFYKKLALECSGQQIAVDLFLLCSQYVDIATISCVSKFSSGSIQYYPGFHHQLCKSQVERFTEDLRRYLTRKVGFEAVMRIRCTRGLAIHTFHGNFFVRSTDLLSLPNVNPDIGFGMQIAIEENLTESNTVCFQAAVLYTSSSGERRIRVHTLSLPVVSMLNDVWGGADQEAIIGLVSKMAVDRSTSSSLSDARDALINVSVDLLGAYKHTLQSAQTAGALMAPYSARLIPLFVLALLKHMAFRTGVSTKLDERVFSMERMKTLPLSYLMKYVYPTMYPVHALDDTNGIHQDDDAVIPQPVILQLSSEKIDRHGAYILDTVDTIYLYVGRAVNDHFCQNVLGVPNFSAIPEDMRSLPDLPTPESERMRSFVSWLQDQRPSRCPLMVIREDSNARHLFLQYMLDDRTESLFSYYEFLQHLRQQITK